MTSDVLGNIIRDLHPLIVHFPIAMWTLLFAAAILQRWWRSASTTGWVAQLVGLLGAIVAVMTGLRDHEAYEATTVASSISTHELLGFVTTALFASLTIWRFIGRRRQRDPFTRWYFVAAVSIGFVLLAALGYTGGQLVFEYGVGVNSVNPLLTP